MVGASPLISALTVIVTFTHAWHVCIFIHKEIKRCLCKLESLMTGLLNSSYSLTFGMCWIRTIKECQQLHYK